jgi:hypothetical protein
MTREQCAVGWPGRRSVAELGELQAGPALPDCEHAAQSLAKGSRVVVVGRLQQRAWTAENGSARSTVEVAADELGPSLWWTTATRTTSSQDE